MSDLTRRWFIIGSAAAIAAAKMPLGAIPVQAQQAFKLRKVWGLTAGFYDLPSADSAVAELELSRTADGPPIFHGGMNVHSNFVWRAMPDCPIIVLPSQSLRLSLRSPVGIGAIFLECIDGLEDGTEIEVVEHHVFPQKGPATVTLLRCSLDAA